MPVPNTGNFKGGLGLLLALSLGESGWDFDKYDVEFYDFKGAVGDALPDGLAYQDTSSAGAPTVDFVADANDGRFRLLFASTNEAETLTLYRGDQRLDPIQKLIAVEWGLDLNPDTAISSDLVLVVGVASDRNATLDDIATNAWFRLQGSSALLVEADDGTTDSDDKATGVTWASGYRHFRIEIVYDAGAYKARFYTRAGGATDWRCVGTYTINASTTNIQPFLEIQKNSASTHGVDVDYLAIITKRSQTT